MKEIVIVAGKNMFSVTWLRGCLGDKGYSSIQCETAEEVIKELRTLTTSGVRVQLVIIEPNILENINDYLVNQLSDCAPEVPFILFDETDSSEIFERICAHRVKFDWDANPLTKMLEGTGVEVTLG